MRSDMGKVVTERPRSGSSNPSAKARWYGRITQDADGYDYDGFTRLPVSRKQEGYHKKIGDKSFTDVLGPIRNYLRSSIGRRWNDVFSEISRTLGRSTWPVRHVLTQHIDVAACTFRGRDGEIHAHDKYGEHKLPKYRYSRYEFFVEPETGILREREQRRPERWPGQAHEGRRVRIPATDSWYVEIKGIWFIGTYRDVEQYGVEWVMPGGERTNDGGPLVIYRRRGGLHYPDPEWPNVGRGRRGGTLVFVKTKQANKRELRRLRELL
jgi:hypothetical protein